MIKIDVSDVIFNNVEEKLPETMDFLEFESSYQRYSDGAKISIGDEYVFIISPLRHNSNDSFATDKVSSHCIQSCLSRVMYVGGDDSVYYHRCLDDFIEGAEKSERVNNTGMEECFVAPYETVRARLVELSGGNNAD